MLEYEMMEESRNPVIVTETVCLETADALSRCWLQTAKHADNNVLEQNVRKRGNILEVCAVVT
jgi:hypothetical protein